MPPRIPRSTRTALPALLLVSLGASAPLAGQFRDARIPEPGRLWLELEPSVASWTDQFALDPSDQGLTDGSREPLGAHFDGPVAGRLYPGPGLFIDDVNADAAALGFDPIGESDFSLGRIDFSTIQAQMRRLEVGFEMGVLRRLSIGFNAPFTLTQVEPSFVFDSVSATVAYADVAFSPGGMFFTDARTALTALDGLIAGGTLTGSELADAISLREGTDTFLTALEGRAEAGGFIPTSGSAAGMQIDQRFAGFVTDFDALGLTLPALTLPDLMRRADLLRLFESAPVFAFPPGAVENGLNLGEVEVSARFGLIDQITRRAPRDPDSTADPAGLDPATGEPLPGPGAPEEEDVPLLRIRTTIGAMMRVPIRSASFPPHQNAAHFLDVPIGDGQTDVELSLYQDIAVGSRLLVRSSVRYGIQRPDEVILRIAPPDQPYAYSRLQTLVQRDLGDYLMLTIRPGLRVNSALTVGLEYDYFNLGAPSYALAEPLPDAPDASPLELEGSQTRHRVGLGFVFDLSDARDREALIAGERPVGKPWQFGISIRRAVSGSGGRTPASFRFGAGFRIPIRIF